MARPAVGVIKFSGLGQGWSERYFFPRPAGTETSQSFLVTLQNIVYGRSAFLGTGCQIEYARVSIVGPRPDKRTCVLPYPIGPHPSWQGGNGPGDVLGPPNDLEVCPQMTSESADGVWGNRYIHGVPDAWVISKRLPAGLLPYFTQFNGNIGNRDLGPAGGLSHLDVCQTYWAYLAANTVMGHRNSPIDYTITPIIAWVYQQITRHKVGRPIRQSVGKRPPATIR